MIYITVIGSIFLLSLLCFLSGVIGYCIGKDKIVFEKKVKLTPEEKEKMAKMEEEQKEAMEQFNEIHRQLANYEEV